MKLKEAIDSNSSFKRPKWKYYILVVDGGFVWLDGSGDNLNLDVEDLSATDYSTEEDDLKDEKEDPLKDEKEALDSIFKVGDKVYSKKFGEGVVHSISTCNHGDYRDRLHLNVNFNSAGFSAYNRNGEYLGFEYCKDKQLHLVKSKEKEPSQFDSDFEFKEGDEVKYAGLYGRVICISGNPMYPVSCKFKEFISNITFTADGRENRFHKQALLEFISRKKDQKIELSRSKAKEVLDCKDIYINRDDVDLLLTRLGFK